MRPDEDLDEDEDGEREPKDVGIDMGWDLAMKLDADDMVTAWSSPEVSGCGQMWWR